MLTFVFVALMFSATFRKRVERVARAILSDPIRVVQGDVGEVNIIKYSSYALSATTGIMYSSVCQYVCYPPICQSEQNIFWC